MTSRHAIEFDDFETDLLEQRTDTRPGICGPKLAVDYLLIGISFYTSFQQKQKSSWRLQMRNSLLIICRDFTIMSVQQLPVSSLTWKLLE